MDYDLAFNKKTSECISELKECLQELIEINNTLIAATIQHPSIKKLRKERKLVPEPTSKVLPLWLLSVGSSAITIQQLLDRPSLKTRECYCIARSFVETAINICFVIAEGPSITKKALRHARQKSFKDLDRESKIGPSIIKLFVSNRPDPVKISGLSEEIAEFTTNRGRDKDWIDLSIDERILAAGRLGSEILTDLHIARFAIYRHSSEIIHGTLAGVVYFWKEKDGNINQSSQDLAELIGNHQILIFSAIITAMSAIINAFNAAYGFSAAKERLKLVIDSLAAKILTEKESEATEQKNELINSTKSRSKFTKDQILDEVWDRLSINQRELLNSFMTPGGDFEVRNIGTNTDMQLINDLKVLEKFLLIRRNKRKAWISHHSIESFLRKKLGGNS